MKKTINDFTLFEELWHAVSHGLGLFLSTFGFGILITLAAQSGDALKIAGSLVFGIGLIIMYGASTLYHAIPFFRAKYFLQIFDHAAIYILIASTYTPVALLGVQGIFGWAIFGIIWGAAAVGTYLKVVYPGRFERFSLVLYGLMGWFIVIAAKPLIDHAGWLASTYLLIGGIVYTLGIYFYAKDAMKLNHAVWHLFVLVGSFFHYLCVFLLIKH